ncbi:hypothetical protein ACQKII_24145 [Lysinibacillus sp. NPDC048646]|uniref:hypothetical protein n=1 Tax=Lysinibacillus sp. NPDC048646 TaxID=3390574 RepID=UPI003D0111CF
MGKILKHLEKKSILILGVLIAPFLLIPAVSGILKLSLLVGEFLPSYLLLLEIDTSEKVSISTFIYYYTCFLAIEVTGILSYAVYKLSSYKEKKEKKDEIIEKVILVNRELRVNLFVYNAELYTVGGVSCNLKKIIKDKEMNDYGNYLKQKNLSFNTIEWEKHKFELEIILKNNNEEILYAETNEIYNSIYILNNTKWSYNLPTEQFKMFDKTIEKINSNLEMIVEKIMQDKINIHS